MIKLKPDATSTRWLLSHELFCSRIIPRLLSCRYWNQLNEDIRILLQRFDAETGDESEKNNEHDSTTSFLTQLATWHKQELDEKLASRVQVSQRAVAKIIQVKPQPTAF